MKVRIINQAMAEEMAAQLGRQVTVGAVFEAWENWCDWMDEDGKAFAYEVILEQDVRTTFGMWVHQDEVALLTMAEELAALGHPGYSEQFAEQVLLYMAENDCPANVAITIITGKDALTELDTQDHPPEHWHVPFTTGGNDG